ncbi:hypothetical protein LP421_05085 (plasmid) [Rhizobium sp. RCAM05350]|nr:hypothetical protein LP421_05085 [Rhizobium sp. RCAM05350]
MHIDAQWHSHQGTKTPDNRDHAGIGTRPGEFLGIVADGATTGQSNGEYACAIIRAVVDWFVGTTVGVTPDGLVEQLRMIQQGLIGDFPRGSASYVILHAAEKHPILVLHAGDSLFGKVAYRSEIQWRTEPHTLANALAKVPLPRARQTSRTPPSHPKLPFQGVHCAGSHQHRSDGGYAVGRDGWFLGGAIASRPDVLFGRPSLRKQAWL